MIEKCATCADRKTKTKMLDKSDRANASESVGALAPHVLHVTISEVHSAQQAAALPSPALAQCELIRTRGETREGVAKGRRAVNAEECSDALAWVTIWHGWGHRRDCRRLLIRRAGDRERRSVQSSTARASWDCTNSVAVKTSWCEIERLVQELVQRGRVHTC